MDKTLAICALGEILIDFTPDGFTDIGYPRYIENPGGGPVNLTAAAAAFGVSASFIGKIGDDAHGHFARNRLRDAGVDTSAVVTDTERGTTLAFVTLQPDGERDFTFYRRHEADLALDWAEVDRGMLEKCRIFHVDCLSLTAEPARTATENAARYAKSHGALLSYDPNFRENLCTSPDDLTRMRDVLSWGVDFVKVSAEEGEMLTGETEPAAIGRAIVAHGATVVAVTMGKDGALLVTPHFTYGQNAYPVHAIDATGAGDTFWGTFLSAFTETGLSLDAFAADRNAVARAAAYGAAAAALCTTKKGGLPSIPTRAEVEKAAKALLQAPNTPSIL